MSNTSPVIESRLHEAIRSLRAAGMVVVTDDALRENEGDLVALADRVTDATISFMIRYGRGLVCVPITARRARSLALPPMVRENEESLRTAFTVSVDAAAGITTGISAQDRARTIRLLADPATSPRDLVRPGHLFPLVAREGGVLERSGHTEAAVDLARLAGADPSGVICEILGDDGRALTGAALAAFCRRHTLPLVTIEQLIEYRTKGDMHGSDH